jgi:hypothetical protein
VGGTQVVPPTFSLCMRKVERVSEDSRSSLGKGVESAAGAVAVGRGSSCCRRLSPSAGASVLTLAPFPAAAHRTGLADLPHPALGRDSRQGMRRPSRTTRLLAKEPCASCLALPSSFFH